MKIKSLAICTSFIIGVICRYMFIKIYGYFFVYVIIRFGITKNFIGLFPKDFASTAYFIQNILEVLVIAFTSILIPAIIFGYLMGGCNKNWLLYSFSALLGVFSFDVVLYNFIIKDFALLVENYSPIYRGLLVAFIWFFLFKSFYYLGGASKGEAK